MKLMDPKKNQGTLLNNAQKDTLQREFPGAIFGNELDELTGRELAKIGFTDDNTLFADSTCPDEINHDDPDTDVTSLF